MIHISSEIITGKFVLLPITHTASKRYFIQMTQDAMIYVRKYGTSDLFITFTCNPTWPEIKRELKKGQTPSQRHDYRDPMILLLNIYNLF